MPSFDTLSYAKALQQGGVPTKQAEAMATSLLRYFKNEVATKSDITLIRTELKVIYWALGILVIGNVAGISLLFSFVLAQQSP